MTAWWEPNCDGKNHKNVRPVLMASWPIGRVGCGGVACLCRVGGPAAEIPSRKCATW